MGHANHNAGRQLSTLTFAEQLQCSPCTISISSISSYRASVCLRESVSLESSVPGTCDQPYYIEDLQRTRITIPQHEQDMEMLTLCIADLQFRSIGGFRVSFSACRHDRVFATDNFVAGLAADVTHEAHAARICIYSAHHHISS